MRTRAGWVPVASTAVALVALVALTACAPAPATPSPTAPGSAANTATTSRTGGASAELASLRVAGRGPLSGYRRAAFGPAWTDANGAALGHNGCDTRNDVLRRDLRDAVLKPGTHGCVVLSGTLPNPYTGTTIEFVRGRRTSALVQIDHVVALGDAWQTGAQRWTVAERTTFANDPLELLAVDAHDNEAKGDADAASWLPPNKPFRCAYVARQVQVKARYRLAVTPAERDAMQRVLSHCATS